MTFIKPLLSMKHWQIFVALIGGIVLFEFIMFSSLFATVGQNEKPRPGDFNAFFIVLPIMMAYTMYFTYGWQWAIISLLRKKLPEGIKINHRRVKAFFVIPMVYVSLIFIAMLVFMSEIMNSGDPEHYFEGKEPGPAIAIAFLIIVPLHIFSIFCMFHTMYFAAKTLKAVELQKEVTFNDFAAEFFLIWFNVIGLWILQPRLNKIAAGNMDVPATDVIDDLPTGGDEVV